MEVIRANPFRMIAVTIRDVYAFSGGGVYQNFAPAMLMMDGVRITVPSLYSRKLLNIC